MADLLRQKTARKKKSKKKACCKRAEDASRERFKREISEKINAIIKQTRKHIAAEEEILFAAKTFLPKAQELYDSIKDDTEMQQAVFEAQGTRIGAQTPADVVRIRKEAVDHCRETLRRAEERIERLREREGVLFTILGIVYN